MILLLLLSLQLLFADPATAAAPKLVNQLLNVHQFCLNRNLGHNGFGGKGPDGGINAYFKKAQFHGKATLALIETLRDTDNWRRSGSQTLNNLHNAWGLIDPEDLSVYPDKKRAVLSDGEKAKIDEGTPPLRRAVELLTPTAGEGDVDPYEKVLHPYHAELYCGLGAYTQTRYARFIDPDVASVLLTQAAYNEPFMW